jgi:hypothetical protein
MKTTLITLLLFLRPLPAQSDAPVKIKLLGSYRHNGLPNGDLLHNILVPKHITKDQLIAVAKELFNDRPGYYHFFTDDKEFQAFMDSDLDYLKSDKPKYPYPEEWANKHYVAQINKHATRGYLGEWALWAISTTSFKFVESPQDSMIISLGKPEKTIQ